MTISIEEAKAFITDCKKSRDSWLKMAERSWGEIKKRQKNHRLWSITPNSLRKRAKYPVWYSIMKIRQPIVLSRPGIPICRDTTMDGSDPVGATAAMIKERLVINGAKDFPFFENICCARDDFLATDFGFIRAYYEKKDVKEVIKKRLTPQKDELSQDIIFIDNETGKAIYSDDIGQDEEGYFLETDRVVDVTDEKICLEPVLYNQVYIDPNITRWHKRKRLAFEVYFSELDFKRIFGYEAWLDLAKAERELADVDEASPKRQSVKVFEYWDIFEKEIKYWAENGSMFITPKDYTPNEEETSEGETNGIYNLKDFFPGIPITINQSTDEFWPVPEFYQFLEIIEDIHGIFTNMFGATKAIRIRLLFDESLEGLKEAINELGNNDAIGITNLAGALQAHGGNIENAVQYVPVAPIIEGLSQLYTALEQRLNALYKLTGISDLLQGLITDTTERTFGERQLLEKYALNQTAERQRKMAEFACQCYALLGEMMIKNLSDKSLEKYAMPKTLPPEHQARYPQAIALLRDENERFRIELETDSTISLNEQYDKQMRVELVNTLTNAIEKTANIAEQNPSLVAIELRAMKFLIQGFRQGKVFQDQITEAIDNVIKQAQAQAQNQQPAFDKDRAMFALEDQKVADAKTLKEKEMAIQERLEVLKLQQNGQFIAMELRLQQLQTMLEDRQKANEVSVELAKLKTDLQAAMADTAVKREAVMVQLEKISQGAKGDTLKALLDKQAKDADRQLAIMGQRLDALALGLEAKEKQAQETRLAMESHVDSLHKQFQMLDIAKQIKEAPQQAPNVTIHMPPQAKTKKSFKIERDLEGNMKNLEVEDING